MIAAAPFQLPAQRFAPFVPTGRTFIELEEFAQLARDYQLLRMGHPTVPAAIVHGWLRDDHGMSFREYVCQFTRGHDWGYSGTAYGGDDESYHGEGRCLCVHCGADGDA